MNDTAALVFHYYSHIGQQCVGLYRDVTAGNVYLRNFITVPVMIWNSMIYLSGTLNDCAFNPETENNANKIGIIFFINIIF